MEFEAKKITSERVINVGFKGETQTERVLSNFAPTPFELDGDTYACVEAFWQMLKFAEDSPEREEVASMDGRSAKKAAKNGTNDGFVRYKGSLIASGSGEHHILARRAIQAKFEQNSEAQALLLGTGCALITHELRYPDGTLMSDSVTLPRDVFCQILMDVREELGEARI